MHPVSNMEPSPLRNILWLPDSLNILVDFPRKGEAKSVIQSAFHLNLYLNLTRDISTTIRYEQVPLSSTLKLTLTLNVFVFILLLCAGLKVILLFSLPLPFINCYPSALSSSIGTAFIPIVLALCLGK